MVYSPLLLRRLGERARFRLPRATADLVGRYAEAGATDFTFYLSNPADPLLDEFVLQHRAATRDQLERVATEVFPCFRS